MKRERKATRLRMWLNLVLFGVITGRANYLITQSKYQHFSITLRLKKTQLLSYSTNL